MKFSGRGALLVPAKAVNPATGEGTDARLQIDTGADISAICLAVADKIGIKPKYFHTVLDADGDPITAPVFDVDLHMGGCVLRKIEMIGLDMAGTGYTGLIGNNILDQGLLVRDGESGNWYFSIGGNVCAAATCGPPYAGYLVAGFFGLSLGVAGTLLLTRK